MDDEMFASVLKRLNQQILDRSTADHGVKVLTKTESQVLRWMVETNNDSSLIRENLSRGKKEITAGTLRKHRQNLYSKLNIQKEAGKPHDVKLLELFRHIKQQLEQEAAEQEAVGEHYIRRQSREEICLQHLQLPGAIVRVQGGDGSGKTSFANFIAHNLDPDTIHVVWLSLNELFQVSCDYKRLLISICAEIAKKLKLNHQELIQHWKQSSMLAPNQTMTNYVNLCLKATDKDLVFIFDDLDRIYLNQDYAVDFCSLLRSWHETSKRKVLWGKVKQLIIQSTSKYGEFDVNRSPLANVGFELQLPDFSKDDIKKFFHKFKNLINDNMIEEIMNLLGGNPFLLNLLKQELVVSECSVEDILDNSSSIERIYSSHCLDIWKMLSEKQTLEDIFKEILFDNSPSIDRVLVHQLEGLGLIQWPGDSQGFQVKNRLYRDYFYKVYEK